MTEIVESLAAIGNRYDAVFCDLWGCVHDGVAALPEAVEALRRFKAGGGTVVLLTNAPRPRHHIQRQIARLGVPEECWDTIATSGDSARAAMFTGAVGQRVWFVGERHDEVFFEPLHLIEDPVDIKRVELEEADGIVCCGPFDPHAEPGVLRGQLHIAKLKGLKLLCANPDLVVDRGDSREWCAGAIAALYDEMGGESLYFGKPHPPIYDLARRRMAEIGREVADDRILAIGDGIATDIAGAVGEGIDSLFVSGGLAAEETGTIDHPDSEALQRYLGSKDLAPTYVVGKLR